MTKLTAIEGFADYFKVAFKIAELRRMGKKVHIIYDVDHVLVSGRSHDVFDWLLDRDVATYHRYEQRQFLYEQYQNGERSSLSMVYPSPKSLEHKTELYSYGLDRR